MFGDLFSQRGNYSDGLFYAGHRRYLSGNQSSLLPPDEFKTKRQLKNTKRIGNIEATDEKKSFQINFQKKHENEDPDPHKKFKRAVHLVKNVVSFEHFSVVDASQWITTVEAGVHLWINKSTGEVSSVCPWPTKNKRSDSNNSQILSESKETDEPTELGTGFLVYDRSDLDNFFIQLDEMK